MQKPISPALIRLFCLLIFIAFASIAYLSIPDQVKTPIIPTELSSTGTVRTDLPPAVLSNSTIEEDHITRSTTTTVIKPASEQLSVTLKTFDRTYTLKFQLGTTLLEAMRQLAARSEQPFMFSGKEYSSLGFFVDEINGIKNDPGNGKYWIYYINGQTAQIGISNYKLIQGDIIEWKYETSKF